MNSDKIIVVTGEERFVLVDDFISPNIAKDGPGSGRTMRRALQYVLIALKAGGVSIECEDHEGGTLEVLNTRIIEICSALSLKYSSVITDTGADRKLILRISDLESYIKWEQEETARQIQDDAMYWAQQSALDLRALVGAYRVPDLPTLSKAKRIERMFEYVPPPIKHNWLSRLFHKWTGQ